MALMMVVAVLALATVLGYAMLSSAALSNRAGANQAKLLAADYLAESGINLAMYYLQHPDQAPAVNAQGYWSGTGGEIALGSSIAGTVNVTVTRDADDIWTYEVVSAGKSGAQGDSSITRATGARLYVRNEFVASHAGGFNNDAVLLSGTTFNGNVFTSKNLGVRTGSLVTGVGYCKTYSAGAGFTTPAGGFSLLASPGAGSPTNGDIFLYKTYNYDDQSYNCDVIPAATTSYTAVTKGTSASNPAGIWYRDGSGTAGTFTLNDNVIIDGTLVIEGNLNVRGQGIIITPQPGYPALIVTGNMDIAQARRSITCHGVVYIGGQLRMTTLSIPATAADYSRFNVNGALLIGTTGTAPVNSGYAVVTTVTYDATKAKAPDLSASTTLRAPKGINVLRWGLP
jgi:hypothetical protein